MKKFLLLVTLFAATYQLTFAQRVPISVVVTDETGSGLPGANVLIKGTTDGGITDANGKATLNATPDAVLQISSIGYTTKEITVGNRTVINHQMELDVTQLSEVIVTGYATEQKKDIVGSVAVVKTAELLATPSANVQSQLQGRSPGVTVSSDGTPGGSAKVRVRGFGSFGNSDPLYVIDGVPVTSNVDPTSNTNAQRTTSPIDNLNPADIESMQVLKDAAAASIYGARAANGVIIITTKKGSAGSAKFTYDGYYGSNFVNEKRFPDLLNAQEYGEMYWQQMKNAGIVQGTTQWTHPQYGTGATPVIPEYILVTGTGANNNTTLGGTALEALKISNPTLFAQYTDLANYNFATRQIVKSSDTDWFKETYNPAMQQSHQIGASGGSDRGNYAVGLNYFSQDNTTAKTNFFNRYTVRSNSSFKIKESIRLGENLQVSYQSQNNANNGSTAWTMHPLIPILNEGGDPASSAAPGISGDNALSRNPVTEPWRNRFDITENWGIFGNVFGEVDIVKGLTARTSFGIDQSSRRLKDFTPRTYEHAENTNANNLSIQANIATTWTWTNTLSYSKVFAEVHNFKIMAGTEAINSYFENTTAGRQDYNLLNQDNPDFQILDAGLGAQTNSGTFERNALFSLFGRVDYSYGDKYLFNATIRQDQSSKFASDTRTGYFPAVAAGWRISSEEFLKGISWINDLKLRASWGVIGNQTGLNFLNQYNVYVSTLGESYPIAGGNGAQTGSFNQSRIGNPAAQWEENVTTNIGLDATLFNNSLDFTVEWYQKQTNGLLVNYQPPFTGNTITVPALNVGDMQNTGIDLGITKRGNIIDGFKYEVGVTFSHYKNEVTRISDNPAATLVGGNTRAGNVTLTSVGNPISMFYGYQIEGFFNTQEEVDAYTAAGNSSYIPAKVGRWRMKDVNGDKVVNALDRTILGSPHPKFQLGTNIVLGYKNFDLTAFLFWNYGNKIYNQSRYSTDFNTFNMQRSARMLYESWTPELGDKAKLPILDLNDTYSNQAPTSYYVEDASYLRLKTLQLGYTFPRAIVSKLKIDKLRLYVQGQNLFTVTSKEYSGLDPDAGLSGGADLGMGVVNTSTPTPQQVLVGVSLGF